jgi:acetoin utilization protein AcuB
MLVTEIMTEKVHTVYKDATLEIVNNIFKKVKYHHLLVTEENKLVGVLSDRDVNRLVSPFLDTEHQLERDAKLLEKPVEEFMTTTLVTVDSDTSIDCASILLLEHNISCLPIVSVDNEIEGILTWKDLLKYYVYASGT